MDAFFNFAASVLAFGTMYLLGRYTAGHSNYVDGLRDGKRAGLEYAISQLRVAREGTATDRARKADALLRRHQSADVDADTTLYGDTAAHLGAEQ